MTEKKEDSQFQAEVLAAEFEEIAARRKNAHASTDGGGIFEPPCLTNQPTIANDLVGLACSGGGIRSASFSLGVIQFLISKGLFKKVDYLSTVSGGGYTGSCISALTKDKPGSENLLTERIDGDEPAALNHIRNYSEYLKSEGRGRDFRIPFLFVEGVLRSILTFFPIVILAVFFTEIFFEFTGQFSTAVQWSLPIVGVVPLACLLAYRPIVMGRVRWAKRDRGDAVLIRTALLAIASVVAIPFLSLLRQVVEKNAASLQEQFVDFVQSHIPHVSIFSVLLAAVIAYYVVKLKRQMVVVLASIMAPLSLFLVYIFLCIQSINSPYVHKEEALDHLVQANRVSVLEKEYLHNREVLSNDTDPSTILNTFKACLDAHTDDSGSQEFCDSIEKALPLPTTKFSNVGCESHSNAKVYSEISLPVEFFGRVFNQKDMNICDYSEPVVENGALRFDRIETPTFWQVFFTMVGPKEVHFLIEEEFLSNEPILVLEDLKILNFYAEWWLYALGALIQIYNWLFINVNRFSLHPFYRDRLSRTFLITPKNGEMTHVDELKLSELNGPESAAPYHIVNTALNLQGSENPQLRSRKTVPFILSKRHCGSELTGYCKTEDMEKVDEHLNLATAMAISAAAASPNMGTMGKKSLSFLLTLLNVRLNYWLPHPEKVREMSKGKPFPVRPLGLSYLMQEALAKLNEKRPYVNCSDGGHIENLAVYELLRRQCKTIICIDAEADPTFSFFGLITLQRYAEIDLGITLELDLTGIRPEEGVSARNHTVGYIRYPNGETGRIIYLKLSFTGKEAEYLHYYREQNPAFPHQSTSDQFFDETQFEVYRALGNFVATSAADELEKSLTS